MSEGARSVCEIPAGFPAGGALLAKLSPWGLIALDAGRPVWANAHACALAGCADLPELTRWWRNFARGWADRAAPHGPAPHDPARWCGTFGGGGRARAAPSATEPQGGAVDKTSAGRTLAFRYEIHPIPE